jgi:hypothetical protein
MIRNDNKKSWGSKSPTPSGQPAALGASALCAIRDDVVLAHELAAFCSCADEGAAEYGWVRGCWAPAGRSYLQHTYRQRRKFAVQNWLELALADPEHVWVGGIFDVCKFEGQRSGPGCFFVLGADRSGNTTQHKQNCSFLIVGAAKHEDCVG